MISLLGTYAKEQVGCGCSDSKERTERREVRREGKERGWGKRITWNMKGKTEAMLKKREIEARRTLLAELRGMNTSALHDSLHQRSCPGWIGKDDPGV
jgi:hypothetical protein